MDKTSSALGTRIVDVLDESSRSEFFIPRSTMARSGREASIAANVPARSPASPHTPTGSREMASSQGLPDQRMIIHKQNPFTILPAQVYHNTTSPVWNEFCKNAHG